MRICEICGSQSKDILHRQSFILPNVENELFYNVVLCIQCGFVYADNIPDQESLDSFYKSAEHHLHSVVLPEGIANIHKSFFNFLERQVPNIKNAYVLDVGSAMGHFLSHFKNAGVSNILGLEPSQAAKKLAKIHYDIDIETNNLSDFVSENKFDLITLSGVLEHIEALDVAIEKIESLLNNNGLVFIAVPDAEKFASIDLKEPFLEFALEHINFFSKTSLGNIFSKHGFELIASKSEYNEFYNNYYLLAIFNKNSKDNEQDYCVDDLSRKSILDYAMNSNKLLAGINARIDELCANRQPIVIWGAGAFATRLCATTALKNSNLIGFVDKNPQLQGKKLFNKTIYPPDWINTNPNSTILIASSTYAENIESDIKKLYAWQGNILRW